MRLIKYLLCIIVLFWSMTPVNSNAGGNTFGLYNVGGQNNYYVNVNANHLAQDFSLGAFPVANGATATNPTTTLDARGATKVTFDSANAGQFGGVVTEGVWDFSSSDLFGLDIGFDNTQENSALMVFVCFDSGKGFNNYAVSPAIGSGAWKPGHEIIHLKKSEFTLVGNANWASVKRIEVRLYKTYAPGSSTAYIYGFYSGVKDRPRVMLTFDDGKASVYTDAFSKYMLANGIKGTVYLNGGLINTPVFLSLAQVQEMYAAGWDVANHTFSHTLLANQVTITRTGSVATANTTIAPHNLLVGQTVVIQGFENNAYNGSFTVEAVPTPNSFTFEVVGTPETPAFGIGTIPTGDNSLVVDAIQRQTDWINSNGFPRGANHFAYPWGVFSSDVLSVLQGAGFLSARGTNVSIKPAKYLTSTIQGLKNPFDLVSLNLGSTVTATSVLASIDDAITRNESIILVGHTISPTPNGSTEFSDVEFGALIQGIKSRIDAGVLEASTISEWYNHVSGFRGITAKSPSGPDVTGYSLPWVGHVEVGGGASVLQLALNNDGSSAVDYGNVTLKGADLESFAKVSDSCSGAAVQPSGSCSIQLAFLPASAGSKSANLVIPLTGAGNSILNFSLLGTGVAASGPTDPTAPVKGVCGPPNLQAYSVAPASSLCLSGDPTGIAGNGPWTWGCTGANGGVSASCSVQLLADGRCGSSSGANLVNAPTANLCGAGAASGVTGSGPWSWSCAGSNGGTAAGCSAQPLVTPASGACGIANGASLSVAPASYLCSTGLASSVSGSGPWHWTCASSNVGAFAACSAGLQTSHPSGVLVPQAGKTKPDISDALRIMQIIVGNIQATASDLAQGDVAPYKTVGTPGGDGKLDISDVIGILRMAIGLM